VNHEATLVAHSWTVPFDAPSAKKRARDLGTRALGHVLASVVPRTPLPLLRNIPGGPPNQVEGQLLDPQVRVILASIEATNVPEPWELGHTIARRQAEHNMSLLSGRGPRMAKIKNIEIPGVTGTLRARIYRPARVDRPAPVLVYFHGGGWVLGSLDTHDAPCRLLAAEAQCVVISVDYGLAPEHPFPSPGLDAIAAYRWVRAHADNLDLDANRIAVGGDSAGGNLAAVVCQAARDEDFEPPRFALLIYPGLEMARTKPSHRTFADGYILTAQHIDWFLDQYVPPHTDPEDPRLSPLCVADVAGLCPAHVVTAGYDPLRDEGEAYATRLQDAGIDCTQQRYPSMVHGFLNMIGAVRQARSASVESALALRRGLSG